MDEQSHLQKKKFKIAKNKYQLSPTNPRDALHHGAARWTSV